MPTYATFSNAIDAIIAAIEDLKGPDGRTLTDIYNKIDASTADLTNIEAALNTLISPTATNDYTNLATLSEWWEILLNLNPQAGYTNLRNITGVELQDSAELIDYPPTLGGILLKLQNIQGDALTSRQGWPNERTKLKTIYDALSDPPGDGLEDPLFWWNEVKDLVDLSTDALAWIDFFKRGMNTAANAATVGTTGATAIAQWLTAMSLAALVTQAAQQQGALTNIETNTNNLVSIDTALASIDAHLDNLMSETDVAGKLTLWELLQQLECICDKTSRIARDTASLVADSQRKELGRLDVTAITATGPADLCQRARWFVGALSDILDELERLSRIAAGPTLYTPRITADRILEYYANYVGADMPAAQTIATIWNSGIDGVGRAFATAVVDLLDSYKESFVCAIYGAADPADALAAWQSFADSIGAEGLAAPTIIKLLMTQEIANGLFADQLPLNPDDMSAYSNDCSGCGGAGFTPATAPSCFVKKSVSLGSLTLTNNPSRIIDFGSGAINPSGATDTADGGGGPFVGSIEPYISHDMGGWGIRVSEIQGIYSWQWAEVWYNTGGTGESLLHRFDDTNWNSTYTVPPGTVYLSITANTGDTVPSLDIYFRPPGLVCDSSYGF